MQAISNLYHTVRFHWYGRDRGNWNFAAIIAGMILLIGSAVYLVIQQQAQAREVECLARNVYHEARGEPKAGKYAVAEVTLNRVSSKYYPNKVCDVVYQQNWDRLRKRYVSAFSWTELYTMEDRDSKAWREAVTIAQDVYTNGPTGKLEGVHNYHAKNVRPSWARKKQRVAAIGRHYFYRLD